MELTHLADTSVLIDPPLHPVIDEPHLIATSVICLGELEAGVLLAVTPVIRAARLRRLTAVTATVPALPVDAAVASHYAEIRAASGRARPTTSGSPPPHGPVVSSLTRDDKLARIPGAVDAARQLSFSGGGVANVQRGPGARLSLTSSVASSTPSVSASATYQAS